MDLGKNKVESQLAGKVVVIAGGGKATDRTYALKLCSQ